MKPEQRAARTPRAGLCLMGLAVLLVIGATGCPVPPPPDGEVPDTGAAVAPGLHIELLEVTIPADLRPEVAFVVTDDLGNRVPLKELTDLRFALAYLDDAPGGGGATRFVNYTPRMQGGVTQATSDPARLNGASRTADGNHRYKFQMAIPANFDRNATHQIGVQVRRRYPANGTVYPAEAVHRFRPDGAAVVATRELVATETCNNCHTRLGAHGNVRREVQHCILCHTPQTFDATTGQSLDFVEMIHKIHMGEDLPSVLAGESYELGGDDFSDVVFPQDIRNCSACHSGAPDELVHRETPTLAGCASCHDRTWFGNPALTPAGFTNHQGGQHINDSLCGLCHTPEAPGVSPIREAHLLPTESASAPGLFFEITDVTTAETQQGIRPTITFAVADKNGNPYATLTTLNSVAMTLGWPAAEYESVIREVIRGGAGPQGTLTNLGGGMYAYTFANVLPADPGLTFGVAMEGRLNFMHLGASFTQGTANNAVTYFTADGTAPVVPPSIVDDAKCNECHREIRAHGEQRVGVELCIMCHNVNATDAARRPLDQMPPATVAFNEMIHRIHTGENLASPYTVYGFGGVPHDFTHVRFPGLRQECSICHLPGTFDVPLPDTALPTVVRQNGDVVAMEYPTSAACTSCHDSLVTNVHAMLATDLEQGIETCAVCHGADSAFAVSLVHRLVP